MCENLRNVKHASTLYKSLNNKLQYWSFRLTFFTHNDLVKTKKEQPFNIDTFIQYISPLIAISKKVPTKTSPFTIFTLSITNGMETS